MKKSFTLVEVLISVSILSVAIAAILKIREHNIDFLDRYQSSKIYTDYIALGTLLKRDNDNLLNKNIYLKDLSKFRDDEARKELKDIKINLKEKVDDVRNIGTKDFPVTFKIVKQTYNIDGKITKLFYRFELN